MKLAPRHALRRCVGDVDDFLAHSWARRPAHHPNPGEARFDDLLRLEDVDRILSGTGLRTPAFRLVKDGSTIPASAYTRSTRTGSVTATGVSDPGRMFQLFHDGATIVLQGMHRFWPPLTRFCRELDLAFGHPTQANAYITPPGARGFARHTDEHDVFVLQAFGRKHWEVHQPEPDVDRPDLPPNEPVEADPIISVELRPGDCLYLPRGTPHSARTQETVSGHVTVGILTTAWGEVLRHVLSLAEKEPAFGERLPVGFHHDLDGFRAALGNHLEELGRWLGKVDTDEVAVETLRRFLTTRPALLGGGLGDALEVSSLDDRSRVRLRDGAICHLVTSRDRLLALLGDRELRMPLWLEPVMRWIAEAGRLRVADLEPLLDLESRLVLVRRLVREGLLQIEVPDAT
jgi:bifunctional lysine-specific demethylase and histidyl-hydroxylase NO66